MYVRPIITYGHKIWAAITKSHISVIQRIQNSYASSSTNRHDTPICVLYAIANTQTIQNYIANVKFT